MKTYTKLPIPKDSAWERKTWRRYTPIWFNSLVDSLHNLIDWLPIIWKDRHWDDFYIITVLQRKLELQREYLVSKNRHTRIDTDNRDMTIVLNLLERTKEEHYALERFDYESSDIVFSPLNDDSEYLSVDIKIESENWDEYIAKYKGAVRRLFKLHPNLAQKDKSCIVHHLGEYNQKRCNDLLWKIMKERIQFWWD